MNKPIDHALAGGNSLTGSNAFADLKAMTDDNDPAIQRKLGREELERNLASGVWKAYGLPSPGDMLARFIAFYSGETLTKRRRDAETKRMEELRKDALAVLAEERDRKLAQGDWAAFGFPTPEELIQRLSRGETVEVRGHTLAFEADIVWCTNVYGAEGVLGPAPGTGVIKEFLTDMANGVVYVSSNDLAVGEDLAVGNDLAVSTNLQAA
jgi:hypothetical protein